MAETTPCPQCRASNDPGSRFCARCGANMAPQVQCPGCNTTNPLGNRFCSQCGTTLSTAGWAQGPGGSSGGVVEGVWERGNDEFIRRVDPEDARKFLGNRSVRVPVGTVGVVLVDGVVDRIVPPGERTTLNFFERISNFFLQRQRTAFYLVDQRPFPVPFVVQAKPSASGRAVKTQVLVSFSLPKGDKHALGLFISNVLGDKPSYAAGELYNSLRPEVVRLTQELLERAVAGSQNGELPYADLEVKLRKALADAIAPRFGLSVETTLAPITALASLTVQLGLGAAPRLRPCSKCKHELPVAMRFCDACGERQSALVPPARTCSKCTLEVALKDKFCQACGTPWKDPSPALTPLFTSDGQQVELDLVVRVQGQHEDFNPERMLPALVGAAANYLRDQRFERLTEEGGFEALEQALRASVVEALGSFGLQLVALSVLDARTKTGQWLLSARADLERAKEDLTLGHAWLAQKDSELNLEELTLAQVLREKNLNRAAKLKERAADLASGRAEQALVQEDALARDQAVLQDREAREDLANRAAKLEVDAAKRQGSTESELHGVQRDRVLRDLGEKREDLRSEASFQAEAKKTQFERDAELSRAQQGLQGDLKLQNAQTDGEVKRVVAQTEADTRRLALETELAGLRARKDLDFQDTERRLRLERELEVAREAQQLAKLQAMAAMERELAAQDQAHELKKREMLRGLSPEEMVALQAAELAKSEGGGAAWANVLAQRAGLEQERKHADELRALMEKQQTATAALYTTAMGAMSEVARSRAEAAPVIATGAPTPSSVVTVANAAGTAETPPSRACKDCGTLLKPGAKFCGGCGATQA